MMVLFVKKSSYYQNRLKRYILLHQSFAHNRFTEEVTHRFYKILHTHHHYFVREPKGQ